MLSGVEGHGKLGRRDLLSPSSHFSCSPVKPDLFFVELTLLIDSLWFKLSHLAEIMLSAASMQVLCHSSSADKMCVCV